jgi:hypothetical protein
MTYDTEYGWVENQTTAVLYRQEDTELLQGQS